jgi:hypothetical protein
MVVDKTCVAGLELLVNSRLSPHHEFSSLLIGEITNFRGTTMKQVLIACLAFSMSAVTFAAPAETAAPAAKTAQQSKMVTCNADATGKKGDERKAFMKTCLSAAPAKPAPTAQQQKMKSCNADAAGKKGDERKAFMKTCLSAAS